MPASTLFAPPFSLYKSRIADQPMPERTPGFVEASRERSSGLLSTGFRFLLYWRFIFAILEICRRYTGEIGYISSKHIKPIMKRYTFVLVSLLSFGLFATDSQAQIRKKYITETYQADTLPYDSTRLYLLPMLSHSYIGQTFYLPLRRKADDSEAPTFKAALGSRKELPYSHYMGKYYLVKDRRYDTDRTLVPYFLLQDIETGHQVWMNYPLSNTRLWFLPVGYVTYHRRELVGKRYTRVESDAKGEYARLYTVMDYYLKEGDVEYPKMIVVLIRKVDKVVVEINHENLYGPYNGFRRIKAPD